MKKVIGSAYRKEGRLGERLNQVIQCQECGAKTYERKAKKIEQCLAAPCRNCKSIASANRKEARQHQSLCDQALLAAHRSVNKLFKRLKPDTRVKHGLCRGDTKRTYRIWVGMMRRCYNPKEAAYELYGGRGVVVCDRWHDVQNFIDDMGIAPDGYSIERNDTHGNYEPLNCQWIPIAEQAANKRNCYVNRHVKDPESFQKQKEQLIRDGNLDLNNIPYGDKNGLGWWRDFGLYINPFIYGPMPWKRTSLRYRKQEAIERGWHVPLKNRKK